jgi:hypothetical protein
MATSSITKNYVISGTKQAEQFANAIEESYLDSLTREPSQDIKITHLRGSDKVFEFMQRRKDANA